MAILPSPWTEPGDTDDMINWPRNEDDVDTSDTDAAEVEYEEDEYDDRVEDDEELD